MQPLYRGCIVIVNRLPPRPVAFVVALDRGQLASLDRPVGTSDDTRLGDLIAGPGNSGLEHLAQQQHLAAILGQANLTPTELRLVQLRAMAGDSFPAIAPTLGLSTEKARKLHKAALSKLRQVEIAA